MAGETEFTIGTHARCSDGPCGEVSRIVIDPASRTVTHLVIEPKHHHRMLARLVPVHLVDITPGELSLRCTLAEFGNLEAAEATQLVQGVPAGGLGPAGMDSPLGIPHAVETVVEDVVPAGESEVRHGERVHALDGEIGEVQGFIVNADDDRVTHVLLKEGHLWGRKEVAIPITAVRGVENGIMLNLTKQQVEDLPAVTH
jgi:sporulation protein YlmC with PRC-barrel domain